MMFELFIDFAIKTSVAKNITVHRYFTCARHSIGYIYLGIELLARVCQYSALQVVSQALLLLFFPIFAEECM